MFPTVADPPYNLDVTTQGSTVTVTWSNGNGVAGHRVIYHLSNDSETVDTLDGPNTLHTFTDASLRVYRVSVQALSIHLPSSIVGPVTARGECVCGR